MLRRSRLQQISPKQRAKRAAEDGDPYPTSTFRRKPPATPKQGCRTKLTRKQAPKKRGRYTGPKQSTTKLLRKRSGKQCEWPGCGRPATEKHHRLNRKQGGRHGEGHVRVNGVAWLLDSCGIHHAYVTSPEGERRKVAERMGWLLREYQDATQVPVQTRHDPEPAWLSDDGRWHKYEEGAP